MLIQNSNSCQNALHHLAGHIREPIVAPGVAVGELLVVDAEKMQDGSLEIVHVDRVLRDVVAEVIGAAIGYGRA